MKRVLKSRVFFFVLGLIIAGSIGVYATMAASSITYNNTTVDLALDDLYNNLDSKMVLNTFGTPLYTYSQGDRLASRTVSLSNLSVGKYLVFYSVGTGYTGGSPTYGEQLSTGSFSCTSSNCDISILSGYHTAQKASTPISGTSAYISVDARTNVAIVNIREDNDTLNLVLTATANSKVAQTAYIGAIPIIEN